METPNLLSREPFKLDMAALYAFIAASRAAWFKLLAEHPETPSYAPTRQRLLHQEWAANLVVAGVAR